jgi:Calx-beta domain
MGSIRLARLLVLLVVLTAGRATAQLVPEGPEFQVNPTAPLFNEAFASIASDAAGNFVVVWRQVLPGVDGFGIYARRYDALGRPLSGPIQVNVRPVMSFPTEPEVTMDADGDFVVVWGASTGQGPFEASLEVRGRRVDRTGVPQGGEFVVASGLAADVASDAAGGFVVVWSQLVEAREYVFGRLFSPAGAPLGQAFQVGLELSDSPVVPRVSREPQGRFVVVWQEDEPGDSLAVGSVKVRRYSSSGSALGEPLQVGTADSLERPDVALREDGAHLVVWGIGVDGQLFDEDGEPLTGVLRLGRPFPKSAGFVSPRVATDGAGRFLVVWSAESSQIAGRLVDRMGRLVGDPFRINQGDSEDQLCPAPAGLGDDGFAVVWEKRRQAVLGRRLGSVPGEVELAQAEVRRFEGAGPVTLLVERDGHAGAVSVSWRTVGGSALPGEDFVPASGTLHWADGDADLKAISVPLVDDRMIEAGRKSFSIVLQNPAGGATLGEPTQATVTIVDDDGWPISLGGELEAAVREEPGWLIDSAVAMDPAAPAGRFALAWSERLPTEQRKVSMRFYSGAETPSGPVLDLGSGEAPSLAWSSQGLMAVWLAPGIVLQGRLFSNGGTPQGAPFLISGSSRPYLDVEGPGLAIAANHRGDAVVVWHGTDPQTALDRGDVFARRLDPAGHPVGGELVVSSQRAAHQSQPDVAVWPDGSFAVVWRGFLGGDSSDVFVRLFNPDGSPRGADLRVNTTTSGDQTTPSVAVDSATGNFLVVWAGQSTSPPFGFKDVFGQLFDAGGRKLGSEFRVNTYGEGSQIQPRVEALSLGGFAVVWTSDPETSNPSLGLVGQDGDLLGIFGQRYDGRGNRVGAEFPVNISTSGSQQLPDLATGPGGQFVVAWTSFPGLETVEANFISQIVARSFTSSAFQCQPSATTMCLNNGRFQVRTRWRTSGGQQGEGRAEGLSNETGFFWFFNSENVEMIVKALDGCGVNQRFWVFAGGLTDVEVEMEVTDTRTGAVQTYLNPRGNAFLPIQDTSAFPTCDVSGPGDPLPPFPEPTACGGPGPVTLAGGRFRVDVEWTTSGGQTGQGQGVPLTSDTGYFCFFGPDNVELVVKVLNGCPLNQRFWVFSGGLTDVQVRMTVTDTLRGETRTYVNPQGRAFQPVQDTSAFATCP